MSAPGWTVRLARGIDYWPVWLQWVAGLFALAVYVALYLLPVWLILLWRWLVRT